ncbi:hypothetical protein GGD41_000459 [Paraburkholderia bryophila]|uniref:Uncharacterized protein n=1 Tax=Paraburkholderia bryophila TaxID=420952 RepID=A0A7Y9W3W2_9BURK|nr:hypothetical protein [Paraburkholderia bryophila]
MARRQFALQRDAQIGDFVFVDEQFAIARDAELIATAHHQIRKQLADKALQQRTQQHEAVRIARQVLRHAHEPRQRARRLHDAHHRLTAECVFAFEFDDEVQALVEHARKRVGRIETDWREHRQQFVEEVVARPFGLRFVPRFGAVKIDAFLFERGQHGVVQHRVLTMHELLCALDHKVVHVLQRHTVRRQRARVVAHLFLQSGHADFEEFVEIATGDADEAQAFEQGNGRVGSLRQHTLVETQNAQLAIQEGVADGHRQREWNVRKRGGKTLGNSHSMMTLL